MQPRPGRQAESAGSTVADEEEAVTAAIPPKATEVIVELSLRRPGFDLHPGRLSDCRLSEYQVYVGLVLAQDTAALPTTARKNQIDQGLKISPVELPDHAKANFAHLDPKSARLRMDRVRFITNATQQIIGVFDGADRHLIAGGTGQRRAQAAHRERLSGQTCFGPPGPGSTVTRRFIGIARFDPNDGTLR